MSGGGEVFLEFIPAGGFMRVAAVDAATGIEAVVIGPTGAARADLERLALAKRERLLGARERRGDERPAPPRGRGRLA